MKYLLLLLIPLLFGCGNKCRGIYYDSDGNKYNEYYQADQHACLNEKIALTTWEASLAKRARKGVSCTPQGNSRTLIASGNYYEYRDSKVYLSLEPSGQYRRIVYGEDENGNTVFNRQLGCYYERDDQLLLDTQDVASSTAFTPWEIFTIQNTASGVFMTRFEQTGDWDYRFCVELNTPWQYCEALRNGNYMYYSPLTPLQQAQLLGEALFMRTQYVYSDIPSSQFESAWAQLDQTGYKEPSENDWKYTVVFNPDTPWFVDQAMRDFVMGKRPIPPDLNSQQLPLLCYESWKFVTTSDGSTARVRGEICYVDGAYTWTALN